MASSTPRSDVLAAWLAGQRWFASKSVGIAEVALEDGIPVGPGTIWIARVTLADGATDRYALSLLPGEQPVDALDDPAFCNALLDLARGGVARGEVGEAVGAPARGWPETLPATLPPRRVGGEQSNTSILFGDALVLKAFRRLAPGVNPEIEMTRFLTERTAFRHTPALAGAVEYHDGHGRWALAVVQQLVTGARDAWAWLLERVAAGDDVAPALALLGRHTGALHLALASDGADPAFAPEPITADDVARWTTAVQRQLDAARAVLRGRVPDGFPAKVSGDGLAGLVGAVKTRHHGDFHLGQVLAVRGGEDFAIIDYEGEPLRPLDERRAKHTPLRDVAGLLRSLAYAAATARAAPAWEPAARRAFLDGYREGAAGGAFLPRDDAAFLRAVAVLEVEKAAYEIVYEANNRPDWLPIPVAGLVAAAARLEPVR